MSGEAFALVAAFAWGPALFAAAAGLFFTFIWFGADDEPAALIVGPIGTFFFAWIIGSMFGGP